MSLRNRLHRWLHPRDPLLEAWKDEPFVQWMVGRRTKPSNRWHPRALVTEFRFRMAVVVMGSMGISGVLSLLGYPRGVVILGHALLLVCLLVLLDKFHLLKLHNSSKVGLSVHEILKGAGQESHLCQLWLSGIRGRDIVKVAYVEHRGAPPLLPPFLYCVVVLAAVVAMGEPVGRHGFSGLALYLLLLVWMRGVFHLARHGNSNPLSGAWALRGEPPPPFALPVLVTSTEIESRNAVVVIFSAGLLVVAAIAGLLYHRLAIHFGLPTTGGLIVQAILSIGAIPLLLLASLERDPRLFEYIETQLPEVDRLFDLHVRQEVLSDPDASRQS